ncbi:Hypothetical_protein [Hexamita inflata]|uniref:Hypothetical_protein n=1 Tax=Hexamita inflata TaxID=28002 RepID=A0ABP1HMB7_9EUKA
MNQSGKQTPFLYEQANATRDAEINNPIESLLLVNPYYQLQRVSYKEKKRGKFNRILIAIECIMQWIINLQLANVQLAFLIFKHISIQTDYSIITNSILKGQNKVIDILANE